MPFREILTALVGSVRGARGAIFCDSEGESVDFARTADLTDYDLKVCGAQLAAEISRAQEALRGELQELRFACAAGTLICRVLPDQYYVALLLGPRSSAAHASFRLDRTARLLAREM